MPYQKYPLGLFLLNCLACSTTSPSIQEKSVDADNLYHSTQPNSDSDVDNYVDQWFAESSTEPNAKEPEDSQDLPSNSMPTIDPCAVSATFLLPYADDFYQRADLLTAMLQIPAGLEVAYNVQWENDKGDILGSTPVNNQGIAYFTTRHWQSTSGESVIKARLTTETVTCSNTIEQQVHFCEYYDYDNFDESTEIDNKWQSVGDAKWSEDGWLELTENAQARQGAFLHNGIIQGGSTSIRFAFKTGDGLNGGADGLALTFIQPNENDVLLDLVAAANPGGALGYGIGGDNGFWNGEALTIEIDTWANIEDYEPFDPTTANHIAITGNADPAKHLALLEVPDLDDDVWHDLRVDILSDKIRIYMDGLAMLEKSIAVDFVGGQMFFSASTGWASNRHLVDNLEVYHQCQ